MLLHLSFHNKLLSPGKPIQIKPGVRAGRAVFSLPWNAGWQPCFCCSFAFARRLCVKAKLTDAENTSCVSQACGVGRRQSRGPAPQRCHGKPPQRCKGSAGDSYGSHNLRTNSQTCMAKSVRTSLSLPSSKPWRKAMVGHGADGVSPQTEGSPDGSPASEGSLQLPGLIPQLSGSPRPGTEQGADPTPASKPHIPSAAPLTGSPPPCLPRLCPSSPTREIQCNTARTTHHH